MNLLVSRTINRLSRPEASSAEEIFSVPGVLLACSIVAGLVVYALVFVRPVSLFSLHPVPGLGLWALVNVQPSLQIELIVGYVVLGVFYFLGWWALGRLRGALVWWMVMAGAALAAFVLLFEYPFGAADIFDNIIHGRILAYYHANPFIQIPASFPYDPFYLYAGWHFSPSAYGPLWELMAGGTARLAGQGFLNNVLAFKLLPGSFFVGCVLLTASLLRRTAPERALRGVWLLAWNPLALTETFGTGHNDAAMLFFILLAVWAFSRRAYTPGVVALTAGALIKYIPVLLLPAALWIALAELQGWKRLRFLALAGTGSCALAMLAYAPFWQGLRTVGIEQHSALYTTSLAASLYYAILPAFHLPITHRLLAWSAAGLTAAFAVWQALRHGGRGDEPAWLRLARAGLNILLFYLLVTVLWFQEWYWLWPLGLAALLPGGPLQGFVAAGSFTVLLKPLVVAPYLLWRLPLPREAWREPRLTAGVMGLPWLASIYLLARRKWI